MGDAEQSDSRMPVSIEVLGELRVIHDGQLRLLPSSRKTRALLAFLALTARPHRRDRLCEIFWEMPDDPRGALRWSLSKIRPLVDEPGRKRLVADRERVTLETREVEIDLARLREAIEVEDMAVDELAAASRLLAEPLLAGIDLEDHEIFQRWLVAERLELQRLRAQVLSRLARAPGIPPHEALPWTQQWLEIEPFSTDAATHRVTQLAKLGQTEERDATVRQCAERFHQAGIPWQVPDQADPPPPWPALSPDSPLQIQQRQRIQFCTVEDGVRIAFASIGKGTPIIKAANWLSHLELDWNAPIWSPLFRELARDHQFVRYDERGNGLSDWKVADLSFNAFVTDLEAVVEATGLERFALLGISQGAAVSIEYAARHPGRVSHLILFGGYPAGWRIGASEETTREREAVMTLTRTGWGQDNPAYRQIFSSTFMPSATAEELSWFNEFQRQTTSPENAVRFLSAFGDIDVRHRLAEVKARTLVIHSLGDRRIPVEVGHELAASIPGAEFLALETDGHLLLGREPASQVFVEAVREFIARP